MAHLEHPLRTAGDQVEKGFMKAVSRHELAYKKFIRLEIAYSDARNDAYRCEQLSRYPSNPYSPRGDRISLDAKVGTREPGLATDIEIL